MKARIRFGVKHGLPFFPNAGVFVFHMEPDTAEKFSGHVQQAIALLRLGGKSSIANKIVLDVEMPEEEDK